MDDCPIICECRRSVIGGFILAWCAWTALCGSTLLGTNFGTMLADLLAEPHTFAPALLGWTIAFCTGLFLTISGVRPALEEGDDAQSWLISLAAIGAGTVALGLGWHLPGGGFWSLANEGLYVSIIGAGSVNVSLNAAARGYKAGYHAASARLGLPSVPDFDRRQWQSVIDRQSTVIASLTVERDQLADSLARVGPPARDLQEVLQFPGIRKAVLKALHRDSHPGLDERDARALDEKFKKASSVFERIGGRGAA